MTREMMKIHIMLLTGVLVLSGCEERIDNLPPDVNATFEAARTGLSENAVKAEVGNFLLLRQNGFDVALKIVEHTRPSQDDAPTWGARYECFVFEGDDYSRFQKHVGDVYEREVNRTYVLPSKMPEYVDCRTFEIQWSLADWIYFDDSISAMARTDKTDIKDVNFMDDKLQWHRKSKPASSISPTSSSFDINAYSEQIRTGVGGNAIRAEVGKFILLKRDGPDVALKIVEHTRPDRNDAARPGASYECFVFEKGDHSHFNRYVGEVYEPDEGIVSHAWIDYGTFRIQWSEGDWIHFSDWVTAMTRTDRTDIKDVNFADEKLQWHYRKDSAPNP